MADDAALKKRLRVLMNMPENQVCCDCGDNKPTWASLIVPPPDTPSSEWSSPIGAFCCFHCSGSHRRLGVHICFVRSLTLDDWKEKEVVSMEKGGNTKVNKLFENKIGGHAKPDPKSDMVTRNEFIQEKYQKRKFYEFDARALKMNNAAAAAGPPKREPATVTPPRSVSLFKQASMPSVMAGLSNGLGSLSKPFNANFGAASFSSRIDFFAEKDDEVSLDLSLQKKDDPFQSAPEQRNSRDALFNSSFNMSFSSGNIFTDTTAQSYRGTERFQRANDSRSSIQPSTQRLRERADSYDRGRSHASCRQINPDQAVRRRSNSRDDGEQRSQRQHRRSSADHSAHGRRTTRSRSQSRTRRTHRNRESSAVRRHSNGCESTNKGRQRPSRTPSDHSSDRRTQRPKSNSQTSNSSSGHSSGSSSNFHRRSSSRNGSRRRNPDQPIRASSEHVSPQDRDLNKSISRASSQENLARSDHTPPAPRFRRTRSDDTRGSMKNLAELQNLLVTPGGPDGGAGRGHRNNHDDIHMPLKGDEYNQDRDRDRERNRDRDRDRDKNRERRRERSDSKDCDDQRSRTSSTSRRPRRRRSNDRENGANGGDDLKKGRRSGDHRNRSRPSQSPPRPPRTGQSPRMSESKSRNNAKSPRRRSSSNTSHRQGSGSSIRDFNRVATSDGGPIFDYPLNRQKGGVPGG